jgi:DNA modification methylase
MSVQILKGDCRDVLRTLPDESVHCVVTSPPYWGLRDYGVAGQIGLEANYADFVAQMVAVFREVRRLLRKDGTLWLNLGDSYSTHAAGRCVDPMKTSGLAGVKTQEIGRATKAAQDYRNSILPEKNLIGIPWRVAFALQADGWWLRQDIIWSKPNPMPESVTDRCTKAHEYLFLLTKSERYYFDQDAIAEAVTGSTIERLSQPTLDQQEGSWRVPGKTNGPMKAKWPKGVRQTDSTNGSSVPGASEHSGIHRAGTLLEPLTRNRRSVWEVTTQPFSEAHFATFPPALIEPCILAGCPRGGTVLDPFGGAGTTGLVADRLGRNAILIELNPDYAAMADRRINADAGMFAEVVCT